MQGGNRENLLRDIDAPFWFIHTISKCVKWQMLKNMNLRGKKMYWNLVIFLSVQQVSMVTLKLYVWGNCMLQNGEDAVDMWAKTKYLSSVLRRRHRADLMTLWGTQRKTAQWFITSCTLKKKKKRRHMSGLKDESLFFYGTNTLKLHHVSLAFSTKVRYWYFQRWWRNPSWYGYSFPYWTDSGEMHL